VWRGELPRRLEKEKDNGRPSQEKEESVPLNSREGNAQSGNVEEE